MLTVVRLIGRHTQVDFYGHQKIQIQFGCVDNGLILPPSSQAFNKHDREVKSHSLP